MDALILRAALLLSLPVSTVSRMQATDVLCVCVAASDRDRERSQMRDLRAVSDAFLVNAAVWAPDRLKEAETAVRHRAGVTTGPVPMSAAMESQIAALPLSDG